MGREVTSDSLVSVEASKLASLEDDSKFLSALVAAGVDNWGGYEMAYQIYDGELNPEDI